MVVEDFKEQGYPADKLLKITGLARSSYYYKSTGNKAGKRKSSYFYKDGMAVNKEILLEDIKELLSGEFVDYGYFKTYKYLKEELGYSIGSTRTYQIMKENNLLRFFIVRNDNGSQFIASIVQEYFVKKGVSQEFIKPATPEQNTLIESYHSIMESAVCQRFEFENLKDLKATMNRFRKFYNFERIHGGLNYLSPLKYLKKIGFNWDNLIHE